MKRLPTLSFSVVCLLGCLWVSPTLAAEPVLDKVANLQVVKKTERTVTVKWKKQTEADHYQVRVLKKNGQFLKSGKAEEPRKTVKGLRPGHRYIFRVRAKAGGAFGPYSDRVRVRTKGGNRDILFGFWGLNGFISTDGLADVSGRLNASVFQVASSSPNYTVSTLLPLVRSSGMKVTLRMSGSHDTYTTAGDFDVGKWKMQIAAWQGSGVQEFIDDGTLVGHMLLDDIDTFAGTDATASDLDEMARYSEQIMPGLMTFVRQQATEMPVPSGGQYRYVDAVVNQYTSSDGPVQAYADVERAAADDLGVMVINGLNICDGGDGSSGQSGWRADKYAMSADEIRTYGEALLDDSSLQMFLLWEYDGEELWSDGTIGSDYFDQLDLQSVLAGLGERAVE